MSLPQSPELPWRSPEVRDLANLLTGTSPWQCAQELPSSSLVGPDGMQRLAALDAEPTSLRIWLGCRPRARLGLYAEQLLAFWFGHAPHIELCAHNLVLNAGGRTLGEFDFLLKIDGVPWHLETCSKFYLQTPDAAGDLVGPSLRDALVLKQRRLDRQLALSRHPLAATVLPPGFADCRIASLVRGCLFFSALQPVWPDDTRWCGWTAPLSGPWPQEGGESRWLWLPRMRWLSPALAADDAVQDACSLRVRLAAAHSPQMVAEMVEVQGGWRERRRGFVMPGHWPEAARLSRLRSEIAGEMNQGVP